MTFDRSALKEAKRIVVKVGTSTARNCVRMVFLLNIRQRSVKQSGRRKLLKKNMQNAFCSTIRTSTSMKMDMGRIIKF